PAIFAGLRTLLAVLDEPPVLAGSRSLADALAAAGGDPRLLAAVSAIGVPDALVRARRDCRSADTLRRRVRQCLDGFRTLKLVHALRDGGLASLSVEQAIDLAPFTRGARGASLESRLRELCEMENDAPGQTPPRRARNVAS